MNTLITPQHLTAEVEATLSDLRTCLRGFGDAALNRRPQPDSWTAGQVVEHILKSAVHAIRAINGPAAPTGRRPDEKVAVLHAAFLEDDRKLKSPDFVAPAPGLTPAKRLRQPWKTCGGVPARPSRPETWRSCAPASTFQPWER